MSHRSLFFGASGRFSLSQYWSGLAMCLFLVVTADTSVALFARAMPAYGVNALSWPADMLASVLCLYVLYLFAAIHIRRLHDVDRSGLLALSAVVTVVGVVPLVAICGLQRGTIGPNRFGPDPLLDPVEAAAVFDDGRR